MDIKLKQLMDEVDRLKDLSAVIAEKQDKAKDELIFYIKEKSRKKGLTEHKHSD